MIWIPGCGKRCHCSRVFIYLPSPVTSIYHVCFTSKPFAHDCLCYRNSCVFYSTMFSFCTLNTRYAGGSALAAGHERAPAHERPPTRRAHGARPARVARHLTPRRTQLKPQRACLHSFSLCIALHFICFHFLCIALYFCRKISISRYTRYALYCTMYFVCACTTPTRSH